VVAVWLWIGLPSRAADLSDPGLELFEKQIRPALITHCVRCHGEEKQQGNLRLDSRQAWIQGGDSGPAIVPGDRDSLLLQVIRYEHPDFEMPPKGRMTDKTIAAFENWVQAGAADPRVAATPPPSVTTQPPESGPVDSSFWSFQPITAPQVPRVQDHHWPRDEMDRFVLATLESNGLSPSVDADPQVLLRRLHYDLTGLPPTPEQIERFCRDPSAVAYARIVDQLLESEQFGQRWGRHWLDVVRYAESSGGGRTLMFPDAWRYRDYVIDSLNSDVPYSQFLVEQIAGDLLPADDWQQRRRNLIATAFLLLGPTNYELQDKDVLEMDVVDEQLDTMGKALLGMTLGCARCHDHKFDPIPAHDYYALAGILKSSQSLIHANVSEWNQVELPPSPQERATADAAARELAAAQAAVEAAKRRWMAAGGKPAYHKDQKSIDPVSIDGLVIDDQQAEIHGNWKASSNSAYFVGQGYLYDSSESKATAAVVFRPQLDQPGRYEVRVSYAPGPNRATRVPIHVHHRDGITSSTVNQRLQPPIDDRFVSLGVFPFDPADQPRIVVACQDAPDGVVIADAVILRLPPDPATDDARAVMANAAQIEQFKAEFDLLTERVKQLTAAMPTPATAMAIADRPQPGDIHLAIRGSTHAKGDLTPRGAIQAISWQPFPSIATAESGRRELAEWIVDPRNPLTARVIVNRIWHWLIGRGLVATVDNFGSTGDLPSHPELLDHLASSFVADDWSIKRQIRRIVRSRTYQQSSNYREDGAAVDPENRLLWRMNRKRLLAEDIRDTLLMVSGELQSDHGGSTITPGTESEYGYQFTSPRRSVYVPVFRNALPEIFEVFDFADPNIQRGKRSSSTVSSQALFMMNHPFVIEQSRIAAARLAAASWDSEAAAIERAYLSVLGRPPTAAEAEIALDFDHAMLYQLLFQCIDFRYLK
jgi:cytochrome c553